MDPTKGIILCDTSYIIFYRYYAILNWFKKYKQGDVDTTNITECAEFMTKYDSTFEKFVVELAKKNKVPYSNIVFAKDCPRERIWRFKIYPEYKGLRDERVRDFNGEIFNHTLNTLFPRLIAKYGFHELYNDSLEADDIIALMVKEIAERRGKTDTMVMVITNDNDYIQLHKYNTVLPIVLRNLQGKNLIERIHDVDKYLLYKIIVGDKSDNIYPIAKKIGDKTAKKIVDSPDLLAKYLADPLIKRKFEQNEMLISFDKIPVEDYAEVMEDIRKLLI
jgi:5'-3' exonuclease